MRLLHGTVGQARSEAAPMTKTSRCANCGAELADDAVDGQCPRCLLRLALAPPGETGAATGEIFGPYRTIRVLGEGGMGIVYLAEQDQPIHRLVALKVIKLGMDTEEVIARFESERQALAMMDHPGIARVYDAGATPEGRPYFAMEYVEGVPITKYCDERRLTVRRRSPHHEVLRRAAADRSRTAGPLRSGVRRGAARTPEGHHPPRPEAIECAGAAERGTGHSHNHRFRPGEGARPEPDWTYAVHAAWRVDGYAGVHESRTGRRQPRGGYPDGCLLARPAAVRVTGRRLTVQFPKAPPRGHRRNVPGD